MSCYVQAQIAMNSDPLDELLHSYSKQSLPTAAERLSSDVWQTIRLRRQKPFWSRLLPILNWHEVFAEPRLVVSALAVALAVGVVPAMLARHAGHSRLARESLHFEIFSVATPAILDKLSMAPAPTPRSQTIEP